jgi:DNA-directed RNA polymerase subunit K/omega
MSEMDEIDPVPDRQLEAEPESDGPLIPSEPAPPINSRFLFVDVAALRAKQLRRGARPRLAHDMPPGPHKAERVAMEEVRNGLVYYDVPPPRPVEESREA